MTKSTLSRQADFVLDAASGDDIALPIVRALDELPDSASPGARQIAQVVAWRHCQDFVFDRVMTALQTLQAMNDWSKPYLVSTSIGFDWRTAPLIRYSSFEDFYDRELAATWGKWSDLQKTYQLYRYGELDLAGVKDAITKSRAAAMQALDAQTPDLKAPHRPIKCSDTKNDTTLSRSERGTPYALARLRKERPNLHTRVLAGELTANAAMVEARFRKKRPPDPMPGLTKMRRAWKRATDTERATFKEEICQS